MKPSIAVYLQHYLSPSMTFIYRQLKAVETNFKTIVLCSNKLENTDRFPFNPILYKRRNFIRIKESIYFQKLYGWYNLLSVNPRLSYQQKKFFKNIIIEKEIKLIHAQFGPAGLEISRIAKTLNVPIIVSFHGYDASKLLKIERYRHNLQRVFDYAGIIAVSDYMKDRLVDAGAKGDNITVIRYGIHIEFFDFKEREAVKEKMNKGQTINFLQVSNFVEKKGHEYTLLAYRNFLKKYNNSHLILGGDGPLREKMQKYCFELGIEKSVKFMGLVEKETIRQLMNNADIFLHHSITSKEGDQEGIPNVMMEAMATGLPVISTKHSGIPELISDNYDGYLVDEKDVDSYTRVLVNIQEMPEDIGIKAREKIVNYYDQKIESEKLIAFCNKFI